MQEPSPDAKKIYLTLRYYGGLFKINKRKTKITERQLNYICYLYEKSV